MAKFYFTLIFGFILGALVIENKALYTHQIAQPVAFLPDGGEYDGPLQKGELDSAGLIIWPFGDRYEGGFKEGLYHGKGRLETSDFIYEGDFFEGVATGEAKIIFVDGRQYQGEVEAMKANGLGEMITATSTYRGAFKNNQYHGEGVLIEDTGRKYEGFFEASLFAGEGQLTQSNGAVFQGTFVNGLLNGVGQFIHEDVRYEGEFKDGLFEGDGQLVDQTSEYIGEFVAGYFQGKGRYEVFDDFIYEGEFSEGKFSGTGVLAKDHTLFQGNFLNGLKEGQGVLTFAEPINGVEILKGQWRAGRLISSDQETFLLDDRQLVMQGLYQQQNLLDRQLASIVEQNPEQIDLYFLGIAGDGRQDVFRRDAVWVRSLLDEHYQTSQRSMLLVNGRNSQTNAPWATKHSIDKSLDNIASKMDVEQDILFLFLSGSSSEDGVFHLEQPGVALADIAANDLGEWLNQLPVKNKIIMLSSCYAGRFIPALKDDNTMVIVASSEDKKSFACGGYRQNTPFINAFFENKLSQSLTFAQAFDSARDAVAEQEEQLNYPPSEPLIFKPRAVLAALKTWYEQLETREPITPVAVVAEPE